MGSSQKVKAPAPQPTVTEQYTEWLKAYPELQPMLEQATESDLAALGRIMGKAAPEALGGAVSGASGVQAGYAAGIEGETAAAMRELLGRQLMQELSLGTRMTPEMSREIEQYVRAGQQGRGITGGNSAIFEEAMTKGSAGLQLSTARKAAAQDFLAMNAATAPSALKAILGIGDGAYTGNSQIMTGAVAQQGQQDAQQNMLEFNAAQATAANKAAANQGLGSILGTLAGAGIGYGLGGWTGAALGGLGGGMMGKGVGGMF